MAAIAALKRHLAMRHERLIEQVETKYAQYIQNLLQQKKQILIKMQKEFYRAMDQIHTLQASDSVTISSGSSLPQHPQFIPPAVDDKDDEVKAERALGELNKTKESANHRKEKTNQSKHECPSCEYRTPVKAHLKRHMLTHSGTKPFKCTECGKCFTQKQNLETHERRHSGIRPFECNDCSRKFYSNSKLNAHRKYTHLKDMSHTSVAK